MKSLVELETEPWRFDFHVALRRLECAYPDRPRSGQSRRPSEDAVRLGQDPTLAFAPAPLAGFRPPSGGKPGKMRVAFLGLFGPNGPLPLHLTEHARNRLRGIGDRTFAAFVDLFHHRMLTLFHRAWSVHQPTACQDRPDANPYARHLASLVGLGMDSLLGRDPIPDKAKLQFVSRLACPTRNAEGLEAMVGSYFGVPVELEQFVGEWLELPDQSRWRLGHSRMVSALGQGTIVGRRVFQRSQKFRVRLGPLTRPQFQSLLPGTQRLEKLAGLVRAYVGDEFTWDVRLVMAPEERHQLALGRGSRLGYDAWLGRDQSAGVGVEDIVVEPPQLS